ncbi:MAG: hypothetical protein FWG90_01255 [Oscillospiraceae bacterium]|nr:hypothetical protein [Oscillospiraceae bacterium]
MPKAKAIEKEKNIKLQNTIFDMEERKLMVSPEFLNDAVLSYVSKRLNTINKHLANLSATKSPRVYFTYCDAMDSCLDELIKIEPYFKFKKPVPSEFKKLVLSKREHSTSSMMNRAWKSLLNRAVIIDGKPENTLPFEDLLNEISVYKDRMTQVNLTAVDMYYNSIRKPEEPEEEAAEAPDGDGEGEVTEETLNEKLNEEPGKYLKAYELPNF